MSELICGSTDSLSQLHFITKPAIVVSLIVFIRMESESLSKPVRNLTLMALVFSLLGDVFLMFTQHSPSYFMFGLIAFLLAHLMYILVFYKQRNPSIKPFWIMGVLDIYAIGLFLFLKDNLGEMRIPVLIYILVILVMATSAFLRKDRVSKLSYQIVFLGAIFFMISDSLLALNKFHKELPFANILIMLTYGLAQYFIVFGIKKSL
jgi:uncharacterized membrane protein YhhN